MKPVTRAFVLAAAIAMLYSSSTAQADTVLYSLDAPFAGGFSPDEVGQMIAQPFFLGDNNTVISATIEMGGAGAPTGLATLRSGMKVDSARQVNPWVGWVRLILLPSSPMPTADIIPSTHPSRD